jgi:hypothetical protein
MGKQIESRIKVLESFFNEEERKKIGADRAF